MLGVIAFNDNRIEFLNARAALAGLPFGIFIQEMFVRRIAPVFSCGRRSTDTSAASYDRSPACCNATLGGSVRCLSPCDAQVERMDPNTIHERVRRSTAALARQ